MPVVLGREYDGAALLHDGIAKPVLFAVFVGGDSYAELNDDVGFAGPTNAGEDSGGLAHE